MFLTTEGSNYLGNCRLAEVDAQRSFPSAPQEIHRHFGAEGTYNLTMNSFRRRFAFAGRKADIRHIALVVSVMNHSGALDSLISPDLGDQEQSVSGPAMRSLAPVRYLQGGQRNVREEFSKSIIAGQLAGKMVQIGVGGTHITRQNEGFNATVATAIRYIAAVYGATLDARAYVHVTALLVGAPTNVQMLSADQVDGTVLARWTAMYRVAPGGTFTQEQQGYLAARVALTAQHLNTRALNSAAMQFVHEQSRRMIAGDNFPRAQEAHQRLLPVDDMLLAAISETNAPRERRVAIAQALL
jgi:hypothetical protein